MTRLALALLLGFSSAAIAQPRPSVTVGTIVDGAYGRYGREADAIRDELVELLQIDFDVELARVQGDWTVAGIEAGLDQLLADPDVDVILTLGFVSSHLAARRTALSKPVVAALVVAHELQSLPRTDDGGTGVPNLNYVAVHDLGDLPVFRELVPLERLGVLIDARLLEVMPDASAQAAAVGRDLGFEVQLVPVAGSAEPVLASLDPSLDAIYVLPLLELPTDDARALMAGLSQRGLPTMSWAGEREVRLGAMLGRMPFGFDAQIARRAALNMQRALLGDELASMPVDYPTAIRLTLNRATADAIGYSPTYMLLSEATLIEDVEPLAARQLTLESTVQEAVLENLDLAERDRLLATTAQNIELAGARRLPQVDLDLDLSAIDENRAERALGGNPQVLLSGAATVRQILYADRIWADVESETLAQASRELDRETLRLDISLEAAILYLDLLRLKTFEQIERNNVNLSRSNLELAQLRLSVGTGAPGEVLRWEAQIAADQLDLVDASSRVRIGEIELNRLLNQPTDDPFGTESTSLDDPELLSSQERLYAYLETPREFAIFRRFMALESIQRAPELQAIDSLSSAQERILVSTRRSRWLPDFGVEGGVSGWFARAGAGSDSQPTLDVPGGGMLPLTEVESVQWFAGAFASIPIFEGTAKVARQTQSAEELARLRVQRASVSEKIDARIRTALHDMQASVMGIELTRRAAEASRRNLEIVTETYRRGAATIIELLDAQDVSLRADRASAESTYRFLIDLMRVQRAANRFDFFLTPGDTNDFFARLDAFRAASPSAGSTEP